MVGVNVGPVIVNGAQPDGHSADPPSWKWSRTTPLRYVPGAVPVKNVPVILKTKVSPGLNTTGVAPAVHEMRDPARHPPTFVPFREFSAQLGTDSSAGNVSSIPVRCSVVVPVLTTVITYSMDAGAGAFVTPLSALEKP